MRPALLVLITYDVNTRGLAGAKRLRKVAKACLNKGQRVQNSVFECLLDNTEYVQLKNELRLIIDEREDSLRFYKLGNNWTGRADTLGLDSSYNPEDVLMV